MDWNQRAKAIMAEWYPVLGAQLYRDKITQAIAALAAEAYQAGERKCMDTALQSAEELGRFARAAYDKGHAAGVAEALKSTEPLVCGRDGHTLGCGCDCWVCKQRAALLAGRGEPR